METCAVESRFEYDSISKFVLGHTKSSYGNIAVRPHHEEETHAMRLLPILEDAKVVSLREKINVEVKRYAHYLAIDEEAIKEMTDELSTIIATLNYNKIIVEVTPSSAIKFKIKLDERRQINITKPLASSELNKEDVVFSIFNGKTLLISDVKNIYVLVQGIISSYKEKD
ncbi:hypothetical protein GCM10028807_52070 [Spirosoma daeguense]